MILRIACDPHFAAVTKNRIALGDGLLRIIGAFGMYCRAKYVQHMRNAGFIEEHHIIYAAKRRNQRRAFILIKNRPALIFDQAHGLIAVDGDHEDISQSPGVLEVPQVSNVENVKATVGENNLFPYQESGQVFKTLKLHSPFSSTTFINSS
jgi:hypothetical protein